MQLVNYSSSSESEKDEKTVQRRKKSQNPENPRLPLPSEIKNLNKVAVDESRDPEKDHEGRTRSFAHERGNWATYVFIPVKLSILDDIKEKIKDSFSDSIDLRIIEDVHISLTRTTVLQHHWIQPFIQSIKTKLETIQKFCIQFSDFKIFCNDDRTRTFLSWTVDEIFCAEMHEIVQDLNEILTDFNLPPFYEEPDFHASVAWCLGDKEDELKPLVDSFNQLQSPIFQKDVEDIKIFIENIYCKSGNKMFTFNLYKTK